jgi:predicted RecA/RadA family phage recombinase
MTNFVQSGITDTVLAPYAVLSGGGVKVGGKFGIAAYDALITAPVEISMLGIFDVAKDASTFTDGATVYWDDTNKVCSSTATSNMSIGAACLTDADGTTVKGALTGDATVRVRLHGVTGALGTQNLDGATASQTATATLTAANIIAMNGAPVSVLAAPGAGKAIVVNNVLFEITTTSTAFTGGGVVTFNYTGGSVPVHAGSVPAATVTAGAGTTNTLLGPAVAANGTVVPANTGVSVTNGTAAFAAGTGTAKVFIQYRIVTL